MTGRPVIDRYRRAERLLPHNADKLIFNSAALPIWPTDKKSDVFWYRVNTRKGAEFVIVDPQVGQREPAFEHDRLAAALSESLGKAVDRNTLPFRAIEVLDDGKAVGFEAEGKKFRWERASEELTPTGDAASRATEEVHSPDGKWAALVREGNLFVRALEGDEERQLTTEGGGEVAWATPIDVGGMPLLSKQMGAKQPAVVAWSPDSTRLLTHKVDQTDVPLLHLVQSCPPDDGLRPVHHSLHYAFPGDQLPTCQMAIIDVAGADVAGPTLLGEPFKLDFMSPVQLLRAWWNKKGDSVWWLEQGRGARAQKLWTAKAPAAKGGGKDATKPAKGPKTRKVKPRLVIEESGPTIVEPALLFGSPPLVRVLDKTGEIVWFSQRDGMAHLYLYDNQGKLKNRITEGGFIVREIAYFDEASRTLFLSIGCDGDANPYERHLYRVGLDGGGFQRLTPEDGDHSIVFTPSGTHFVDTWATFGSPATVALRSAGDGAIVTELEKGDVDDLLAAGFRWPEPFKVKSADGAHDLHGMLYFPTDFDPARSYPVLDSIYPGPQVIRAIMNHGAAVLDPAGQAAAMAELGFIVMIVDGRGTPLRSKAFHDLSHNKLGTAGFLDDHIAALRQLSATRPYLDLDRVGIYGHSGGGYASARAMCDYPGFFKVAVASAGNHDARGYYAVWGETYHGLMDSVEYESTATRLRVEGLKGKLLLVHGEMDDNVHPYLTIQLVDSLIKANKDFDLLIIPGATHSFGSAQPYFLRRKFDYFVRHLLGEEPPADYQIEPPAGLAKVGF